MNEDLQFSTSDQQSDILSILCCLASTAILFGTGYAIWESIAENLHWVALALSLSCYVCGFVVAFYALAGLKHSSKAAIVAIYFAFIAYALCVLFFKVMYYDSDAMLFNSYSAQLFMQGTDPYTQSLEPGYRIFGVPEGEVTPTVSGGAVYSLSYPALSFLIYVPFLWYGITNLLWVNVIAHLAILTLLIYCAPKQLKPVAPLLMFLDPSYFNYTVGGVTDVLWIPFAILAAMWWRRNAVIVALWLGIACCFKQTPWLIMPFAFIHWLYAANQERRARLVVVPCLVAIGIFVLVNLPFILWHPKAWWEGVSTPLSGQLVMFGSGLVQLQTAGVAALTASMLSRLSMAVLVTSIAAYALFPKRFAFLPFIAPAIAYFFAPRSLQNYFMYWPMVLVAYVFVNWSADRLDAVEEPLIRRRLAVIASLGALTAAVGIASALHTSKSLDIRIQRAWVNPITDQVTRLAITVENLSIKAQQVRFSVFEQGDGVAFTLWRPKGAVTLPSRASAQYVIKAPSSDGEAEVDPANAVQVVGMQDDKRQLYSTPVVFGDIPPKIQNGDMAHWTTDSTNITYPVSWNFSRADFASGKLAQAEIAGKPAVRMKVQPHSNGWAVTVIGQITDARAAKLRFALYPERDYKGGANPRVIFGAELRDVVGHQFFYTIDSTLEWPQRYTTKRRVIWVLPGHLRTWNIVEINLTRLREQYGFVLSPNATILVDAIAAARGRKAGDLVGYFGGVRAFSDTPYISEI